MRKLLVLSDLHLGRNCNTITGFHTPRPDPTADQALIDLLAHYTAGDESAWRLIFNGDFLDFVEVVVTPSEDDQGRLSFEVTGEELAFGLNSSPERSLVKLQMMFELHERLFQCLARFIKRGGEMVVVRGNHDVELFWEKVQRAFRHQMASWAFQSDKLALDEALHQRTAFQERLKLLPWMYLEPGRIYLEHGHQYDVYCAFDKQLYPVNPKDPKQIDTPLFMFSMRYFVNILSGFSPEAVENWRARDYLIWLRRQGAGGAIYAIQMAVKAGLRMLRYALETGSKQMREYNAEHERRLKLEAERFGVPLERLMQADRLRHVPITRNFGELTRLLYLDRLLLFAAGLLLTFFLLLTPMWPLLKLGLVGLVWGGAYRITRWLEPRRFFLPGPKQKQAARQLARLFEVPTVSMGHCHRYEQSPLDEGLSYVNTGSWLPSQHGHQSPDEPCDCRLAHLVMLDKRPELRIFCRVHKTVRQVDQR